MYLLEMNVLVARGEEVAWR
jgi:hypothetical protein